MDSPTAPRPNHQQRAIVVATPDAAPAVVAALRASRGAPEPVGVVLIGDATGARAVQGIRVLGGAHDLARVVADTAFDTALVCIPYARREAAAYVHPLLASLGVTVRTVPCVLDALRGVGPRVGGPLTAQDLAALVGREARTPDADLLGRVLRGKRVLITGAGGSIGAELARLAADHEPSLLALMDRSENALFEIDRELGARSPNLARRMLLHDVVEAAGTKRLIGQVRPDVVFHAAAHKHVPMMEDHPGHAVTNNLFGTRAVAEAAIAAGAERFVLISTDKAVHPSSVMGATKRLAELYVQSLRGARSTRCVAVRFGNVLGSACSVLPIWTRQIEEGGPVTITDPRMTRYFMTIPEAAALVVQAAALDASEAGGADVFVLDMGDAVRIYDLAQRFIHLRGFRPVLLGEQAEPGSAPPVDAGLMGVVVTGARPGEKLHEELAYEAEELRPTPIDGVMAWRSPKADFDARAMLEDLDSARTAPDRETVLEAITRWTPGFGRAAVRMASDRVLTRAG
jgi:FlaA1/EpsC-like NDP-sugar epimerase